MKGGTIIRLIDVVLIILFGFLFISDYQAKSHVPLPEVREGQPPPEAQTTVFRVIEIFERSEVDAPYYWFGNTSGDDRVLKRIVAPAVLEETLQEQWQTYGDRLQVVIVPLRGARIDWVVEAYDICRTVGLTQPVVRIDRDYVHMTSRG